MPQAGPASTDAELALAIGRGDPDAESELYRRFGSRVLYLAQRELRSRDLAEDARSETFLRTLTALRDGTVRKPESLASFVLQTTRYVVFELRRRQRPDVPLNTEAAMVEAPLVETPDPETIDAVRAIIHDLSPRDRHCLRLLYYDDLPKEEIARRLGIDPERVRLVKSRALARFRRAYEDRD
jgi:RNA polymerase sigma-70 factor (ECF subfamily)